MHRGKATLVVWLALAAVAAAEPLTLKEAISRALQNAPEVRMALAQQEKSRQAWREAKAQFIPSVTIGSGVAATRGFPMSIEGAAPSIFQVVSNSMLFNRPQRYLVGEAQNMWRAAEAGGESRQQEIVWKTAAAYLELNKAQRSLEYARREAASAQRIEDAVAAQVEEGRAIPLDGIRARLASVKQQQAITELEGQIEALQAMLRGLTGMAPGQPIDAVNATLPEAALKLPGQGAEAAVTRAMQANSELRRLALEVDARESRVRAEKAQRWPQLDLVGQYAILSRFNNYDAFFRKFERNNAQLGFSARFSIFDGKKIDARVGQAEADLAQARAALQAARNEVALEIRRAYRQVRQLEGAQEVAKLELNVARESLNITLARFQEGRVPPVDLERSRAEESARWVAFLDANFALERARLDLLRQTGELAAALR